MAEDRGGLRYDINVADGFSVNLAKFRTEVKAARADFAAFKTEAQSLSSTQTGLARSTQEAARQQRRQATETRSASRTARDQVTAARAASQQGMAQFRITERQAAAQAKANQQSRLATSAQRQQATATQQSTRALQQQARAQGRATTAQRRFVPISQAQVDAQKQYSTALGQTTRNIPGATRNLNALNASGKASQSTFQSLLFTFRRLFGVFAAFAAARLLIGAFRALVVQGVAFNAQLEQAELGIAGVIAAAGSVQNAMGGATNAAQAFALAQSEASRQVNQLRRDALATNATFEQLLDTFQTAIGPGLAAGLNVDEIRELSIRISQAATAIGLPQNQLAEEIRSILAGTIQLRTTRLAAVLGITNEDIRNARELGELAQFLEQRFAAFGRAGEESLENLNVLLVNTQDGLRQVLAAGGEGLAAEITASLKELFATLNELDENGRSIGLRPEAVELARAFTAGLRAAVSVARQLFDNLSFEDLLPIAQTFSGVITSIASVTGIFVEGLVKGLSDALLVVNAIGSLVGGVARFFGVFAGQNSIFREILVNVVRIVTLIFTLRGAVAVYNLILVASVKTWKLIELSAIFTQKAVARIPKILVAIRIGLLAIAKSPILILITLLVAAIVFMLDRMGVLQRIFSVFTGDVAAAESSAKGLSDHFDNLAAQIKGSGSEAEKFEKTIERIEKELLRAQQQASFDLSNVGVSGGVREQRQVIAEAENKILKETEDLVRRQETAQQNLLGIQTQRRDAELELVRLSGRQRNLVQAAVEAGQQQLELSGQQADKEAEIASLQLSVSAEKERGNDAEAAALQMRLDALTAEEELLRAGIFAARVRSDIIGDDIDAFAEQTDRTEEQRMALQELIDTRIRLAGQESASAADLAELQGQRLRVEQLINETAIARVNAIASEESNKLLQQNDILETQVINARRLADARRDIFDDSSPEVQLAQSQNALDLETRKLSLLQEQRQVDIDAAFSSLDRVRGTEAEAAALTQVNALIKQNVLDRQLENTSLDELIERMLELRKIMEDPIESGFSNAIDDFTMRALDDFTNTANLVKTSLEGLSSQISGRIADAVFNKDDALSTKQRLGQFLQQIATAIINQLVKIAVAKTILGLNSLFGGAAAKTSQAGGAVTGVLSRHKGGPIPGKSGASFAHYAPGVQSFHEGGPPAGVHPKDTVAAWLEPKEFVHPVSSVQYYGDAFMEAVRQRAIPLASIQALMGGIAMHGSRMRASAGPGYQTGGSISSNAGSALTPDSASGGVILTTVSPTERAVERLFAGGRNARLRSQAEERDITNSLLAGGSGAGI